MSVAVRGPGFVGKAPRCCACDAKGPVLWNVGDVFMAECVCGAVVTMCDEAGCTGCDA